MAFEEDVLDISFKVSTDLSGAQYHFVKLSANDKVAIVSGATDQAIGVLQNKPNGTVTEAVARVRVMGVSRVYAATSALTVGSLVGYDSSGHGAAVTAHSAKYMGLCTAATTTAGETSTVVLYGNARQIVTS